MASTIRLMSKRSSLYLPERHLRRRRNNVYWQRTSAEAVRLRLRARVRHQVQRLLRVSAGARHGADTIKTFPVTDAPGSVPREIG
jgi:hypothetical protein